MQLRDARLCADCDEVHDEPQCPHCASERFNYLSRWVPLPEGRVRPRPDSSPQAEIYRQLINPEAARTPTNTRGVWGVRHGVMSVAAVGVLGWIWKSATRARDEKHAEPEPNQTANQQPESGGLSAQSGKPTANGAPESSRATRQRKITASRRRR